MKSQLVAFLEGSGTDSRSRRLVELLQFDDDEIEYTHDFIQWMFPLKEASGSNFSAPNLRASDVDVIRSSAECQQNLETSASWILAFFKRSEEVAQFTNHNHLRVTRIIKSLRLNRPGFTRHFLAYKFRPSRGCHEWEAIYRGISN